LRRLEKVLGRLLGDLGVEPAMFYYDLLLFTTVLLRFTTLLLLFATVLLLCTTYYILIRFISFYYLFDKV